MIRTCGTSSLITAISIQPPGRTIYHTITHQGGTDAVPKIALELCRRADPWWTEEGFIYEMRPV